MRINVMSLIVNDQARALKFYTEVLGFEKRADVPVGEYRWLTVASPEGAPGMEVLLEPDAHPAAKAYQAALFADGIPATSFASADLHAEVARLRERGVVFRGEPQKMGPVTLARFEDTCGNLIQLTQLD